MRIEKGFGYKFHSSACERCGGKCCTGESGYIFASIKELEEIAEFLGLGFEEFTRTYVKKVGYKFSLLEKSYNNEYACIFFENQKCQIYPVRPKQCRDFPFWEVFRDMRHWGELQKECCGVEKITEEER